MLFRSPARTATVSSRGGKACGFAFQKGEKYLIFTQSGDPARVESCAQSEALRAAKEASRKYCGSRRGCRIEAHWIANSLPKAYDSSREWSVSVTPESGPLQGDPVVIWISVECRVTGVLSVGREMGLEDWQRSFHAGPGGRR